MITAEERKPGRFYSVLDKGFVSLVDFMGGDQRAVESARVTFGSKSKGAEKDRKLVEYLLAHGHHTPFEHSVFQFHVKCPIFVARQWLRHRMACVTGDTELYFDLPSGPRSGKCKSYRMTVEEFFRKWESGAKPIPHPRNRSLNFAMPQRKRLQGMMLRQLKEGAWTLGHTRVLDIFKTGERPVFEVSLEDGRIIRCTKDHRFRFEEGWKTLEAATGLRLNGDTAAYRAQLPRMATNGRTVANPLYRDKEWLETQYRQPGADDESVAKILGVSGEVIRKWRRIHGLVNIKPGCFPPGMSPWNKGMTYRLWNGRRTLTREHLEALRTARCGPRSNFWKGGTATERQNIARWTTQVSARIFERDAFRCRACGKPGGKLHVHHIIPVWAAPALAFDPGNLAAVCESCHRRIHACNAELAFAEKAAGLQKIRPYQKVEKPKPASRYLLPRWMRISSIKYLGIRPTYDLSVEGPFHNYVANGIVTHNSYNEISARYTEVRDEFYVPPGFRAQDTMNRQGSLKSPALKTAELLEAYKASVEASYAAYRSLLEAGVAREMARMVLPVAQYTQFHWTVNARSLMNFIALRLDSHAQLEIQAYAGAIAEIFRAEMPWTWEAFSRQRRKTQGSGAAGK